MAGATLPQVPGTLASTRPGGRRRKVAGLVRHQGAEDPHHHASLLFTEHVRIECLLHAHPVLDPGTQR